MRYRFVIYVLTVGKILAADLSFAQQVLVANDTSHPVPTAVINPTSNPVPVSVLPNSNGIPIPVSLKSDKRTTSFDQFPELGVERVVITRSLTPSDLTFDANTHLSLTPVVRYLFDDTTKVAVAADLRVTYESGPHPGIPQYSGSAGTRLDLQELITLAAQLSALGQATPASFPPDTNNIAITCQGDLTIAVSADFQRMTFRSSFPVTSPQFSNSVTAFNMDPTRVKNVAAFLNSAIQVLGAAKVHPTKPSLR